MERKNQLRNRFRLYEWRTASGLLDQQNLKYTMRIYIQIDEFFQSKLGILGTGELLRIV